MITLTINLINIVLFIGVLFLITAIYLKCSDTFFQEADAKCIGKERTPLKETEQEAGNEPEKKLYVLPKFEYEYQGQKFEGTPNHGKAKESDKYHIGKNYKILIHRLNPNVIMLEEEKKAMKFQTDIFMILGAGMMILSFFVMYLCQLHPA